MNKKAQFYIFIAIVLLTYAFAISRPPVLQKKPIPTFTSLYQNFISESPVVINNAMHDSKNVSGTYKSFVDTFIGFAHTRDSNFGLVYLLAVPDGVVVNNKLKKSINATINETTYVLSPDQDITFQRVDSVNIIVGSITYPFSFDSMDYQLKALFRKEDKNEIRVYVYN